MDETNKPKRRLWLMRLTMTAMSLALTLGAVEVGVRLFSTQGYSLLVKDATVGQRYRPGFERNQYVPEAGRKIPLRFNSLGYRGPDRPTEKPAGVKRVAVLGDSFVAAVAVAEEDTMAAVLEKRLGDSTGEKWEAINFGVSGASTGQSLLAWRHFARQFQPDLVLLCFYNGNDLAENLHGISSAHRPYFYLDEHGELQLHAVSEGRASLSRWLSDHSQFYVWQKHKMRVLRDGVRTTANVMPPGFQILNANPPDPFPEAWRVTDAIIRTLAEEVRSAGAELVVASIPAHEQLYSDRWERLLETAGDESESFDPGYPEKRLAEICNRSRIRFLPLVDVFRAHADDDLHFQKEGHWTERGNRLAADAVFRYMAVEQVAGIPAPENLR